MSNRVVVHVLNNHSHVADQVRALVQNVSGLKRGTAQSVKDGEDDPQKVVLTGVGMVEAGIPCESRAATSSKSAGQINCVLEGEFKTGNFYMNALL